MLRWSSLDKLFHDKRSENVEARSPNRVQSRGLTGWSSVTVANGAA